MLRSLIRSAPHVPEREGARRLLARVLGWFTWLRLLWVDGGYSGPEFAHWVRTQRPKLNVEVVSRIAGQRGFAVLPRRWVVERTFGWLMKQRRLVRDYETAIPSAETWVSIAMIRIMLRRWPRASPPVVFSPPWRVPLLSHTAERTHTPAHSTRHGTRGGRAPQTGRLKTGETADRKVCGTRTKRQVTDPGPDPKRIFFPIRR